MNKALVTRRSPSLLLWNVFTLSFLPLLWSCESSGPSGAKGYLLGWNHEGIVALSVDTGNQSILVPQDESHWFTSPAYDVNSQSLYFVDEKLGRIMQWRGSDTEAKSLCELPANIRGKRIHWLVPRADGRTLIFPAASGEAPPKIMELDCATGTLRELLGIKCFAAEPVAETDESHLLVPSIDDAVGGPGYNLTEINIRDKSRRTLLSLNPGKAFRLFNDKKHIAVMDNGGNVDTYDLESTKLTQHSSVHNLPGYIDTSRWCTVGDHVIALARIRDAMLPPAGTYLFDLQTGQGTKLASSVMFDMK